ncbi:MAG: DUF4038 domain-containing protein [Bacteroidetes bacterium]|nr:DUF4038 domain-containing protein [Bacteroidota bacterium]
MRVIAVILVFMAAQLSSAAQPAKVSLTQKNGQWQLLKNGQPYYIKGAGGTVQLDLLVECGGNTIRTWGIDEAQRILDEAHSKGLMVMLGMWMQHERHGFDYDNNLAVQKQIQHFKSVVDRYKDHPALLMWGIGNEVDLFYSNTKVWHSIQAIAKYVHETDSNHPTCTVTAGLDSLEVQHILEKAPDIDIYGVNTYGDIAGVPKNIGRFGWTGPYMITEWGPNGHWESPVTPWNAAIEQSSREKSDVYGERYVKYIKADSQHCIGSYVFLWGQKQEYTLTWYGLFTKDNKQTEAVDMLYELWNRKKPPTPTPTLHSHSLLIYSMEVKAPKMLLGAASDSIRLTAGSLNTATVKPRLLRASQEESDNPRSYHIEWKLLAESDDKKAGGDMENEAAEVSGFVKKAKDFELQFKAPRQPGAYRLFVTIQYKNKVAYANVPFEVLGTKSNTGSSALRFKKYDLQSFDRP